jgi:hypothetical protein
MAGTRHSKMRELDSRTADGIRVLLLWHQPDGKVYVSVDDAKTGDSFCFEIRDRDRTREVFHHPYAYAAWYGVQTRAGLTPGGASSPTALSA